MPRATNKRRMTALIIISVLICASITTSASATNPITIEGQLNRIAGALYQTDFQGFRDEVRSGSPQLFESDVRFASAYLVSLLNDISVYDPPCVEPVSPDPSIPITISHAESIYESMMRQLFWIDNVIDSEYFTYDEESELLNWDRNPWDTTVTFEVDAFYNIMGDFGSEVVFGRVMSPIGKCLAYARVTLESAGADVGTDVIGLYIDEVKVLARIGWPYDEVPDWLNLFGEYDQ